jgi:hypothetical protein
MPIDSGDLGEDTLTDCGRAGRDGVGGLSSSEASGVYCGLGGSFKAGGAAAEACLC